ncbi:MAG: SDR family oxidoreductase [Acidimicrobiia bacterium]
MLVAVTGASGFIGSHVVQVLLDRGYSVRGTVRDPDNTAKVAPLEELPGADGRLELVTADLMAAEGFAGAFRGCEIVMHIASPYVIDVEDPQRDLVDPALVGTLNVLRAATDAGVRRVVLTSSIAAVTDQPDDRVYTEADWNEKSSLERNPYYYSKTLAERAAWDFIDTEQPSFDLVVINPSGVIGPSVSSGLSTTSRMIADLLNGGVYPAIIDITFPNVDVRDVAEAHVRAAENQSASGRYICSAELVSLERAVEVLRANGFADYKLPKMRLTSGFGTFLTRQLARFQPPGTRSFLETNLGRSANLDTTKIREDLGIEFRDVDRSIIDTANDLIRWGHVKPRSGES